MLVERNIMMCAYNYIYMYIKYIFICKHILTDIYLIFWTTKLEDFFSKTTRTYVLTGHGYPVKVSPLHGYFEEGIRAFLIENTFPWCVNLRGCQGLSVFSFERKKKPAFCFSIKNFSRSLECSAERKAGNFYTERHASERQASLAVRGARHKTPQTSSPVLYRGVQGSI